MGEDVPANAEENNTSLRILSPDISSKSCSSNSNKNQSSREEVVGPALRRASGKNLLASMRVATVVLIVLAWKLSTERFCCGLYGSGS